MTGSDSPLRCLLAPQSVAVVGATVREGAVGFSIPRHVAGPRFRGDAVAINPRYEQVAGLRCYPSLRETPETPECAIFAVADHRMERAVIDAIEAGVRACVILGRLVEPAGLDRKIAGLAREANIAVCGANCMGLFNTVEDVRLSMSDLPGLDQSGHIGLLSHSGSTWSGLGGNHRPLRFSIGASIGNELVTGLADYIEFMIARPETRAIAIVLETVRNGERFIEAVEKADAAGIPIVALKLGSSERAKAFALSHSGALSGDSRVFDAVCRRHNVVRVTGLDELLDTLEVMVCGRVPTTSRVGILTDSGGERQLITDLAEQTGTALAEFGSDTRTTLENTLDTGLEPVNPVDYWGESGVPVLPRALRAIANDPQTGVAVLATNMVSGRIILDHSVAAVRQIHGEVEKPCLMMSNITSAIDPDESRSLREEGIPVLCGTEFGLKAIRNLIDWHFGNRSPTLIPEALPAQTVKRWRTRLRDDPLDAREMFDLLESIGIPTPVTLHCTCADEVMRAALQTGFPAFLKTANTDIQHKSDSGGVIANIPDEVALFDAYADLSRKFGPAVLLQESARPGVELILGFARDPDFGPVMTLGAGGILAEFIQDSIQFIPPVAPEAVDELLQGLAVSRLLDGARGKPPVNRQALARAVSQFSLVARDLGDLISAFDINPLIVHDAGVVAVDSLVISESS